MNAGSAAMQPVAAPGQSVEQLRYARWLDHGTRAGLLILVAAFLAYATGLLAPQVPLDHLPRLWTLPVDSFVKAAGMPTGWGWLRLATRGDVVNLVGIAVLAGCSLPCLLALLPLYARRGDRAYIAICVAQIAVLLLAASGVLTAGH